MRNILKCMVLIICLCFCGCAAETEAAHTGEESFEKEVSDVKEETDAEKENTMFALYDTNHEEVKNVVYDLTMQEVLTVERAQEVLESFGYIKTNWVDLQGNPYTGDNAGKQVLFSIYTVCDGLEYVTIAYSDGEKILYDEIHISYEVNNGCLQFWDAVSGVLYIPSTELLNFEKWAIETGNYPFYYPVEDEEYYEDYYGTYEEIDEIEYKIEASENYLAFDYKDLLRNPMDYWGLKTYVIGDVIWSGEDSFILETIVGDIYLIHKGIDASNVIAGDDCAVFGELDGTAEYTTTNEYGTVKTHTAPCIYAPYVSVGNAKNIPCDDRLIELFYTTYKSAGSSSRIQFDDSSVTVYSLDKTYKCNIRFGEMEMIGGEEKIPVTIEIGEPYNVSKEIWFSPYSRSLFNRDTWDTYLKVKEDE